MELNVPVTAHKQYILTDADVIVLEYLRTSRYWDNTRATGYSVGNRVQAIKWFRARFGVDSLLEAKTAIDHYWELKQNS